MLGLIILLNYNGRKNEIDVDDDFGKWKGIMFEIESYWFKIFDILYILIIMIKILSCILRLYI